METTIGTLNFEYGMPDEATFKKVCHNIDLARAVDVYLNTQYMPAKMGRLLGRSAHVLPCLLCYVIS